MMKYLIGFLLFGLLFSCNNANDSDNEEEIRGEQKQALLDALSNVALPSADAPSTDKVNADEFSVIKRGSTVYVSRNGSNWVRIEDQGDTVKMSFFNGAAQLFLDDWNGVISDIKKNATYTEDGTSYTAVVDNNDSKITVSVIDGEKDVFIVEKSGNSVIITYNKEFIPL